MKNKFVVTTSWDDGHKLDIKLVELLNKYNLKGTLYVAPNDHEFPKFELLTESQIKKISKEKNIEIGGHTINHLKLAEIDIKDARNEIKESKRYLEKITGKKIKAFCYPNGSYNKEVSKEAEKAGFKIARTIKTFETSFPKNYFEITTSVHIYDHFTDVIPVLKLSRFNPVKFLYFYRHWDRVAKKIFDDTKKKGGVFHLWGHSWEIEKNGDWERLENVFKYISDRDNVEYLVNGEL